MKVRSTNQVMNKSRVDSEEDNVDNPEDSVVSFNALGEPIFENPREFSRYDRNNDNEQIFKKVLGEFKTE